MKYIKPAILTTRTAATAIKGGDKLIDLADVNNSQGTSPAYEADE